MAERASDNELEAAIQARILRYGYRQDVAASDPTALRLAGGSRACIRLLGRCCIGRRLQSAAKTSPLSRCPVKHH